MRTHKPSVNENEKNKIFLIAKKDETLLIFFSGINDRKRMFNVRCKGSESELSKCSYKDYAQCRYYDMASVVCTKCKTQ